MRLTKQQESRIRRLAGESRCDVRIVDGDEAPHSVGERVRSTLRAEVGRVWLARNGYLPSKPRPDVAADPRLLALVADAVDRRGYSRSGAEGRPPGPRRPDRPAAGRAGDGTALRLSYPGPAPGVQEPAP